MGKGYGGIQMTPLKRKDSFRQRCFSGDVPFKNKKFTYKDIQKFADISDRYACKLITIMIKKKLIVKVDTINRTVGSGRGLSVYMYVDVLDRRKVSDLEKARRLHEANRLKREIEANRVKLKPAIADGVKKYGFWGI